MISEIRQSLLIMKKSIILDLKCWKRHLSVSKKMKHMITLSKKMRIGWMIIVFTWQSRTAKVELAGMNGKKPWKTARKQHLRMREKNLQKRLIFTNSSSMNSINSGHSFTLMQMNREFRSLEIFRFMLLLTAQIHGHLRNYSSLMKRIIR